MSSRPRRPAPPPGPSFAELFTPKLVTVMREGYGLGALRADALAGLTVAIVALPLSMAIAIASGLSPERGLYAAIVGGFIVSLLGGSRFQIGGPAGAFIVLVAATVSRHGVDGLLLATLLSGAIMVAIGLLRLGTFIKYIPYPVTVGFTTGIAVIIFASQIKEILGLTLAGGEPGPLLPKLAALGQALPTVTPAALAVALATALVILLIRRFRAAWPGMLIAVALASLVVGALGLPVETIGSRFGTLPAGLPWPSLPPITLERVIAVLPDAAAFALLGSIESLLSAVVADSMTGRRHRSNCELVAQGAANIVTPLFGGMCVTGTLARTATNIRAGARGPVAGMLHALILLAFLALAAPLAAFIPLAALGGLLAVVAWNMSERHHFGTLLRASRGDALVVLATFALTIFHDLTVGILTGIVLSAVLVLHRMAQTAAVEMGGQGTLQDDRPDSAGQTQAPRQPYDAGLAADRDLVVMRISGAFFFGAAPAVSAALERIAARPKAVVIDLSAVTVIDSTAAAAIEGFARKARRRGAAVYFAAARPAVRRLLLIQGVRPPLARFRTDLDSALAAARKRIAA